MGPYQYTRNPQYLGLIIAIIGAILVYNSLFILIFGILGILIFLILPFAEEPWLKEQFGNYYEEYFKRVKRFI